MSRNKSNTRLAHKQMLIDLLDEIKNVFESDLSVKVEECDIALQIYLDKKNSKFTLNIYYSLSGMALKYKVFSFRVTHKSVQDRQIVISVYLQTDKDESSTQHSTIFIGRGEKNSKKIYMVEVESAFSSLSLAKLNQKLFSPFGRNSKLNSFDNVKSPFVMINMDFFLVDEENQTILNECNNLQYGWVNSYKNFYSGLKDIYSYSGLYFEYCVYCNGNYYVRGSVTKNSGLKKTSGFSKIPNTCSGWKRIVTPSDSETRWTKSVIFY